MTHEEAGGLVLLAALVLLVLWVGFLRWQSPDALPRPAYDTEVRADAPAFYWRLDDVSEPWTPESSLRSAGSPCRADGCPAMRYAPLDEHLVTAHHAHDNRKATT